MMKAKAFICVPARATKKAISYDVENLPRFIIWIIRCWMKLKGANEDALSQLRKKGESTGA